MVVMFRTNLSRLSSSIPSLHLRFYSASPNRICALIIGAPGSGKGTISNWIVRDFKLEHVSSGDLLRSHIQKGTDLGKQAKAYIDKGDLVRLRIKNTTQPDHSWMPLA